MAITRAPASRAHWIAAEPTPLPAALTSTSSPCRTRALRTTSSQAVAKATWAAAASRAETPSGTRITLFWETLTNSA